MQHDTVDCGQTCDKCQRYAPMNHQHAEELCTLTGSWHFMQWGIDLLGSQEKAYGNKEYLIVATNYFKWIEAKPLSKITRAVVKSFIWNNIICRFGIPHTMLTDNGLIFTSSKVTDWYKQLGICYLTFTSRYPQGN